MSSQAWTRDKWTASNYCAWVEVGQSREERASRLADVPEAWRAAVEAHVRCCFLVRGEAKRKEARQTQEKTIQRKNAAW